MLNYKVLQAYRKEHNFKFKMKGNSMTHQYYSKVFRKEKHSHRKALYETVHGSSVHNSPKVETSHIPTSKL